MSAAISADVRAINMTGDQLHTELLRIDALVSGSLKLISEIVDDNVAKAEALLNMAAGNLLDLQNECNLEEQTAEGGGP